MVQQGRVVIDRSIPPKIASTANSPTHPEVQHATAAEAAFDADTDKLTLTGDVRMWDAETQIAATRVVMDQDAGNAAADGAVKVTYQQQAVATTEAGSNSQAKAEPVHVLAARADLNHDAGRATFYGRVGGGVREPGSNVAGRHQPPGGITGRGAGARLRTGRQTADRAV